MLMRIDIDMTDPASPRKFAAALTDVPLDESVTVRLVGDEICPSRIVPVVGIADERLRLGGKVSFETFPHSAAERAVRGTGPFGSVLGFDGSVRQNEIVNAMVLELDRSANLAKGLKQGFEWCLNEVLDNVLNHSRPLGEAFGWVMTQFVRDENRLKVCVFDTGIGLRASFDGSQYHPANDGEAIALALRRNVTSGRGQGNGLWGLHGLVKLCRKGRLHVRSGAAEYLYDPARGVDSTRECEPYSGIPGTTTVDFEMVCDEAASLEQVFGDGYRPTDLWQEAHETADGTVRLVVAELAESLGTRDSAERLRHIAENAIDNDGRRILLDFAGVTSCSSAFADELVGKLVMKYGFVGFMERVSIRNLGGLSAMLVNSTLAQRMATGEGSAT